MRSSLIFLYGFLFLFSLDSIKLILRFGTFLEATNLLSKLLILIEVSSEGSCKIAQISFVFFSNLSQGNNGRVLLMNELTESSLSFNKTVWDIHLSAKCWEPNYKFNWINIASNDDKLCLFLFNKFSDVIKAELQVIRSSLLNSFFWIK